MNPADRALIVIHRGDRGIFWHNYRVVIDGGRAGFVAPSSATEWPVDPGVHSVEVTIDLFRSPPLQLEVAPESRTDLRIAERPGLFWKCNAPTFLALGILGLSFNLLRQAGITGPWTVLGLYLIVLSTLLVAEVLIGPLLVKDYWAAGILEPMSGSVSKSPSPGGEKSWGGGPRG
jgi:hypothetical protein